METFQEYVGWLACGINALYFLAPVEPFFRVLRGKLNFEETPGVFVTTCYVNCFVWYVYGDMIFSDQVKYSNLIGACASLCLIVIYLIYELKKYLVDSILNALILITGTWAVYRALTIIIDDDRIVGKICIGTAVVMFLSPIQIVYKVMKEKNYYLIPIRSAFVYLFTCIVWIVYGILIEDFYLVCPHSIGIILFLVQIVVYFKFKRKYPAISDKVFTSTIGIESTGNEETKKEETPIKIDEDNHPEIKEKSVKIISKNDN